MTRTAGFAFALVAVMTSAPLSPPAEASARRGPGPSGSLLIVEQTSALPLVTLVVAARTGSASDPRGKEGLVNLAAELARRGAASRTRAALDETLDTLGATLEVEVEPDSVRLVGQVLARHLDEFLDVLADILLRPDFDPRELERTRQEILAQIDELRNDDRALCQRFFERRLYGDHPYGHPPSGTAKSLPRIGRQELASHFKRTFVGKNLVFAASGPLTREEIAARLEARLSKLPAGPAPSPPTLRTPPKPNGWRIQLVDKPDRQQTQIMFGHPAPPATHPDRLALTLALASFGGRGMKSTLMDEVRTKRGLAYGAYMNLSTRRGPGAARGWVFTGAERTVTTLKLVLRLYKQLAKEGVPPERVRFFQGFVAGTYASGMDHPARRLRARVAAEIQGLPENEVDTFADRIRALSPGEVTAALQKHVTPDGLAITLVGTAEVLVPLLTKAQVAEGAMDVVPFESY
jgi:zinc protease